LSRSGACASQLVPVRAAALLQTRRFSASQVYLDAPAAVAAAPASEQQQPLQQHQQAPASASSSATPRSLKSLKAAAPAAACGRHTGQVLGKMLPGALAVVHLCLCLCVMAAAQVAPPNHGSTLGDPRNHLQLMDCLTPASVRWPNDKGWQEIEYDPSWAAGKNYLVLYHLKDGGVVGSNTGNCLAARGTRPGIPVSRGQCGGNNEAGQAWTFVASAGGAGPVVHNASGLCLATTQGAAPGAGSRVILDDCQNATAQLLAVRPPVAGQRQSLQDTLSKLCLDCGNQPQYTSPCDKSKGLLKDYPCCDPTLGTPERVTDLLTHTALSDKLLQFAMWAPAMPSTHVNSYQWWNEGLHGVAGGPGVRFESPTRNATAFPEPCGIATSWNRSLWRDVGATIATEARAMHNAGTAGLTYWAPNINIYRDPRCAS
jgi:hypothetical protein